MGASASQDILIGDGRCTTVSASTNTESLHHPSSPSTSVDAEKKQRTSRTLNRNSVRRNDLLQSPKLGSMSPKSGSSQRAGQARSRKESKGLSAFLDKDVDPKQRIVVIGDLHGMYHKTRGLWQVLEDTLTADFLSQALVVFLGDYCDRGMFVKELLSWLCSLSRSRQRDGSRSVFLLGNHEFCLLAFLGMLPMPSVKGFSFRHTWDRPVDGHHVSKAEREKWWGACDGADDKVIGSMHLQGRRWASPVYERNYGTRATFDSYGTEFGDRDGLLRAMPEEHLEFLRGLSWVHVEENASIGRTVFVHAGLEADSSDSCEGQIEQLRQKDASSSSMEQLFGRENVLHTPPQLSRQGVTVVSGHHGKVLLRSRRIVLDNCQGCETNSLQALVLPETVLVSDDGKLEARKPEAVFGASPGKPSLTASSPTAAKQAPARPSASCTAQQVRRPSAESRVSPVHLLPAGDRQPLE